MKTILYAHGGSGNHGCEALVRTTASLLREAVGEWPDVISSSPAEDFRYIADMDLKFIRKGTRIKMPQKLLAKAWKTATGSLFLYDRVEMRSIAAETRDSLCISIGGDNYCYSDYSYYGRMNEYLTAHGNKTVLWGCSIEPELLKEEPVREDLKRYSLITARESITFEALIKAGLTNVMYCPDTAFLLEPEETELPEIFSGGVVGINVSPMVLKYEKDGGMVMKNYTRLVEHILADTDMNIALIPHVVWDHSDDLEPLGLLYEKFRQTGRVALIDGEKTLNCRQLKYIISRCSCLVAARTHASIAGYSTGVPTLVTGYSVKARGIARDIFGTCEGYVCPVQELNTEEDLLSSFDFVWEHREAMKECMNSFFERAAEKFSQIKKSMRGIVDSWEEC